MLYSEKSKSALDLGDSIEVDSATASIERLVSFTRRRYRTIVAVALISTMLGLVYLLSAPPIFTAQTTLIIDTRKVQLFQQQSILGDIPIDSASVESQIEILKSEKIALYVINKLHLTDDPEFSGSRLGIISSAINFITSIFGTNDVVSEFEKTRSAIKVFQSQLAIKRVGLSYVIEISFRSLNADRAAEIANAVADAYIVDQLDAKDQATKRASVWLQDRIDELRRQASLADRAVVDFKSNNNIVNTGGSGGRLITEQQVAELNSQVIIARAQTAEAQARLDRIQSVLRADSPSATVNSTVADALKSEVVSKLRSQYLDIANREAEWSRRYGANHQAAVNLRNQMAEIRNSIVNELQRLAETYKSDFEISKQREIGVQKELESAVNQSKITNQAQVSLRELESSSQTYRTLYDNFLQRYRESIQQQSFPISEARIISQATRPLRKSDPKPLLVLVISTIGGLILGLGVSIVKDLSDRVFRSAEQVESELGVSCIALLPTLKDTPPDARKLFPSEQKLAGSRTIFRNASAIWKASDDPFSGFAEAIRSIKLAIDLSPATGAGRIIGITSSLPNEGKSTLSASLAQLIGQTGARVILVDCDLRNTALTDRLTPDAQFGIIDVMAGKKSLGETVWQDPSTKMSFLPGAIQSNIIHPNEVLASAGAKAFFERLRAEYNYVIVDLSPLAPVVDVRATVHFIDSYLLVVEWGRTGIDVVTRAMKSAQGVYDSLLGVVLTKSNINQLKSYESYTGYSGENQSRYGSSK